MKTRRPGVFFDAELRRAGWSVELNLTLLNLDEYQHLCDLDEYQHLCDEYRHPCGINLRFTWSDDRGSGTWSLSAEGVALEIFNQLAIFFEKLDLIDAPDTLEI